MDIDTGLFQLVTLALLGVTLLVLVVTLLSLGKLSKKLDEGVGASSTPHQDHAHQDHAHDDEHEHHDHEHHDHEHHVEHAHQEQPASAADDWSAATAQQPAAAEEPAPETVGVASVPAGETPAVYHQPAEVTQELGDVAPDPVAAEAPAEEREAVPAAQEPEPVAAEPEPVAAEPAPVAAEQAPTGAGFEDAPEEQPFERDGRWWFKRGNEILVYDEQTGQWGPAPAAAPVGAASPVGAAGATWGQEEQTQGWAQAEPGQQEAEAAPASTFWKCPSCGAINGATANACRMCFTPKA